MAPTVQSLAYRVNERGDLPEAAAAALQPVLGKDLALLANTSVAPVLTAIAVAALGPDPPAPATFARRGMLRRRRPPAWRRLTRSGGAVFQALSREAQTALVHLCQGARRPQPGPAAGWLTPAVPGRAGLPPADSAAPGDPSAAEVWACTLAALAVQYAPALSFPDLVRGGAARRGSFFPIPKLTGGDGGEARLAGSHAGHGQPRPGPPPACVASCPSPRPSAMPRA